MTTEESILQAARDVFMQKGLDGARMQEIADEAGINKALLHYYFRSKDKLFERIFKEAFQLIKPGFIAALGESGTIQGFTQGFVESYIKLLCQIPYLPQFVLQELNRNPDRLINLFKQQNIPLDELKKLINREVAEGKITAISPEHLIINIISLVVFPFVARPILKAILFEHSEEKYNSFIAERRDEITRFVLQSIQLPKQQLL